MGKYIECRNSKYDKLRVTFWRTRYDGYKFTLETAKRASRKAEDSARVELRWFINRALDLLAGNGFETLLSGSNLNAAVADIAKSIECEVH